MNFIFADSCYWIALLNRNDQLHAKAAGQRERLSHAQVITTDEVLGEVLNFFAGKGSHLRMIAAATVEGIRADTHVHVIEQSRDTFDGGLSLYKRRTDKEYSYVDCVSFNLMTQKEIGEPLTDDHHFQQFGFVALLRTPK